VADLLARRAERTQAGSLFSSAASSSASPTAPRRIMTQEEAIALGQFVREVLDRPTEDVQIQHRAIAVALRTPDGLPRCLDIDEFQLQWVVKLGRITMSKGQVGVYTDVRDLDTLRHVLQHAARPLPEPPPAAQDVEDQAAWNKIYTPHTYTYLPSTTWHASTAAATDTQRGTMLARLVAPLRGTPWRGAGTVAIAQIGFCALNSSMRVSQWGEMTDSEISLTVHSADGTTSGWSGHAHRDWDQLNPERVARESVAMATQQQGALRAEPGRYTTILSATAVGQLLRQLPERFNVEHASPFSFRGTEVGGRDRKGERLFDPHITLTTDPTDPEGGDFPFFPEGSPYPSGKVTWVDHGVLKQRSVDIDTGVQYGMPPLRDPECIRMSGGDTSIEQMIAQCERGIYVNRLATIQDVDRWSATMEGFTRHGCLLIEKGKIKHPIKDFRWYESPTLAFNRVIALGTPQRVAFGFTPRDSDSGAPHPWPYAPVIAPPLMIRDFNFSALADNA